MTEANLIDNDKAVRALRLSRQADMMADPSELSVLIIGSGGIGSNVAHLAISMGYEKLTLMDPDVVAEENVFPGFFSEENLGVPKAQAVASDILARYGVTSVATILEKAEDSGILNGPSYDIVIISTDSLESRQEVWRYFGRHITDGVYVDARMGGTLATVYAVSMDNDIEIADYTAELEAGVVGVMPCGMKATAPLTKGFIPGMIGTALRDIANGRKPSYMQRMDLEAVLLLNQREAIPGGM